MRSLIDDINTLHIGLFGWPIDRFTPIEDLLRSDSFQEATRKLLHSSRARQCLWNSIPLWPEDKWVCTEYVDLRIWVNLHDSYVSRGVLQGAWETDEVAFVMDNLKPGDSMLDVGANVGVYTLQAARAVGETGRVYSFEPQSDVFAMLSRSVQENGFAERCILNNFALGDRDGAASIWRHHDTNPGASFITSGDIGQDGNPTQLRKLDSLAFDNKVRMLKMDVEGYEPLLLAGGETFLRDHKPIIITEWFPRSMSEVAGSSSEEYFDRLSSLGYAVHRLEGSTPGMQIHPSGLHQYEDITEPFNIVCLPG